MSERLDACAELASYLHQQLLATAGRQAPESDQLILAISSRALDTYNAILRLCERGLSEQAAMLIRPLYEAVVDGYWVVLNRDEAVNRLREHRLVMRAAVAEDELLPPEHRGHLTDAEWEQADLLRKGKLGRRGDNHWAQAGSLFARVKTVELAVPQEHPGQLRDYYELANQHANRLLHGSSMAFDRVVTDVIEGRVVAIQIGGTQEFIDEALVFGTWLAFRIAWLVLTHLLAQTDWNELDAHYHRAMFAVAYVALDDLLAADVTDPCPCGSGEVAGSCHKGPSTQRLEREHRRAIADFTRRLRLGEIEDENIVLEVDRAMRAFLAATDDVDTESEDARAAVRKSPSPRARQSGKRRRRR